MSALPNVAAEVHVAFDTAGGHAAVAVGWIGHASGLPGAHIELWDIAAARQMQRWEVLTSEDFVAGGPAAALVAVRALAEPQLAATRIDLDHPVTDAICWLLGSTRSCAARADVALLSVNIGGRPWLRELTPAEGCPVRYAFDRLYIEGDYGVATFGVEYGGVEGGREGVRAVVGRVR